METQEKEGETLHQGCSRLSVHTGTYVSPKGKKVKKKLNER